MEGKEFTTHLTKKIIPFWNKLKDDKFGGFYGEMDYNLNILHTADKGMILNSRILWFYSNMYLLSRDIRYLTYAGHAYNFLLNYGYDSEYGGIYWMLTYDGKPIDDTKHTYNQAFAIYALSSYFDASRDDTALNLAYEIYHLLEDKCKVTNGYLEAFERSFTTLIDNDKLSENGVLASRTMNTLLHIFEAYCELYRVDHNLKVKASILNIYDIFVNKIYNPDKERFEVFFDNNYNSLIDLHSYGHDIEASWLLDRGLEILGKKNIPDELYQKINHIIDSLVANIYKNAYDSSKCALNAEAEYSNICTKKIWWVQAEAVIGFYNGFTRTSNFEFKEAASAIWQYIQKNIVDSRTNGEWIQENDSPDGAALPVVSPWKCPYHNGRMCIEMIKRIS